MIDADTFDMVELVVAVLLLSGVGTLGWGLWQAIRRRQARRWGQERRMWNHE